VFSLTAAGHDNFVQNDHAAAARPQTRRAKAEEKMRLEPPVAACAALAVILSAMPLTAPTVRGVTTAIRIGQTMPYSGPVSAFGALGKGEVGYFKMLNERGAAVACCIPCCFSIAGPFSGARITLHLEMFCSVLESRAVLGGKFSRND
jgi:hypothetical protein